MSVSNGSNINCNFNENGKLSTAIEQCIERITRKKGFVNYTVSINDILTKGDNYLSNLQTIDVIGRTKNGEKKINFFVKNRIANIEFKQLSFTEIFKREAFYYNELVPIYNKLQDDANISVNERFNVAKSYKESNSDVIILEDLTKREYQTLQKRELISFQFAEVSVKELAKYHALSFVLQDRDPEYFENAIKPLNVLYTLDDPNWIKLVDNTLETIVEFLDGDLKNRLKRYKPIVNEKMRKIMIASETIPTSLCHGDFKSNNVMIVEKNEGIKDGVVVDFQLIHYGSPVFDFLFFIFTGTDQKFRKKHLDELKELYYETFQNFLKYFDIDAQHVYSKERFEHEYRGNLLYGLSTFLACSSLFYGGDNDAPVMDNEFKEIGKVNLCHDMYKERLRGMVDDFIQWGYL